MINNIECPYCKCNKVIKFGKHKGEQRYKCKNERCKKTFIDNIRSPFRYAKKFNLQWKKYFKLMIAGKTIRECAKILNITIVTAFYWRHRILYDFKDRLKNEELKEYVELSKLIVKENFKGSRLITNNTRDKIIIINGIDKGRLALSVITARHYCTFIQIKNSISDKINKKAYIVAIQDNVLRAVSNKHNIKNKIEQKKEIGEIDRFFSHKIKKWIKGFYGVATKYIDHYLSWRSISYKNNINLNEEHYKDKFNFSKYTNMKININTYISWKDIKSKAIKV